MKKTEWYQQGDILIQPVDEIPADCKKVEHRILAEGEATGHAHVISEGADLYESSGDQPRLYLVVNRPAEITHQEHDTQGVPPGKYRVGRVVEFDHWSRRVREIAD